MTDSCVVLPTGAVYIRTRCWGRKWHPVGYGCEVVQFISVSSSYSLGDNCLSVCTQWMMLQFPYLDREYVTLPTASYHDDRLVVVNQLIHSLNYSPCS